MAQHPPASPFKVMAVNVNGLAERNKRRPFFASLQKQRQGVVLLSETHTTDSNQGPGWVKEGAGPGRPWQGAAYWCGQAAQGQRAAGGVGVLVARHLIAAGQEPIVEHQSASGRVLKVSWVTPWGDRLAAMAVYAPCDPQQRPDFFMGEYLQALLSGTQDNLMVGGDFNCVMRHDDIFTAPRQQAVAGGRMVGGGDLQAANLLGGLRDAWLHAHPGSGQPTHYTQHAGGMSGGRIDYVFVSASLLDGGWLKGVQQHRRYPSDHRPVVVQLQPPGTPQPGTARWRFPNHLLGVEAFLDQLKARLGQEAQRLQQQTPRLDPAGEWEALQAAAIAVAKQLQQQLQRELRDQCRRLRQQIAAARNQARHDDSAFARQNLLAAEQNLTAFEAAQLQREVAATEPLWEVYGESTSFMFHRLGKAQPEPQFIAEVERADGSTVKAEGRAGVEEAGSLLADYYDPTAGGLFSRHPTDPQQQGVMRGAIDKQLDDEGKQQCRGEQADGSITVAEAWEALRSLPRGKAPGSDGLTYEFYAAMWDVVGQPMVDAFNHCFSQLQPQLSERQRLGLIILIFKGGGKPRTQAASYRPITLLNCDLKIIAKVLVLRFGPAMGDIIDSTQTAFVPGRDIADNVLLHLEEVDYLQEESGQQGCILFLDFEKAYDRLDRGWLFQCMESMGFPDTSIRWVRLLLEGTMGQVLFNGGHLSRRFDIPSGCAQGSPLSPLLYVIAAQPLAARCRQLQQEGAVASIRLPDGSAAPSSHQHADDTTLHGETVSSVRTLLRRAVEPFCAASGAKLNVSKSKGMTLGAHPSLVGEDPETGVVFVDTTVAPIRHLGVLLSVRGGTAFAEQLFEQRLGSVTHRVRQWSQHSLTLLGRCEVARQVLASCLVYHAQFVPVPERIMGMITRRIKAFTLGLGCISVSSGRQLLYRPAAAVANLPVKRGGIGHVDVQAHITAMQGKVAASLLHPHRHPWKLFMRANLDRAAPGVGVRVLVQQQVGRAAAAQQRLNPRHAAYVASVRELGVCRNFAHDGMTAEQVRLELLIGNHSVADSITGLMLRSPNSLPPQLQPRTAGVTLGQVSNQLSFQPAVDGIVLPSAWQAALQEGNQQRQQQQQQQQQQRPQQQEGSQGELSQPGQPPEWEVASCGDWVRHMGAEWFEVEHTGSLVCVADPPVLPPATTFAPACVVRATTGGPRQRSEQQQQQQQGGTGRTQGPASAFYLVGPWAQVQVDPTVWGFGPDISVLTYAVRDATQRLLQLRCRTLPGWVTGLGMRPRLWRDPAGQLSPATALQQRETGQKRRFEQMLAGGFAQGSQQRLSEQDAAAGRHANWMDPSPPRQHPLQRAGQTAAAGGIVTDQRAQQQLLHASQPAVDDTEDPLTRGLPPPTGDDIHWFAAYRRAGDKRLPKALRALGWKVLHAAMQVGGERVYAANSRDTLLTCCCRQPQCWPQQQAQQQQQQQGPGGQGQLQGQTEQGPQQQQQQQQGQEALQQDLGQLQLETLSHMFVGCPSIRAAWQWLERVWDKVQPGSGLSCSDVRVVLLDDGSIWHPPQGLQHLWTHLRLLMLESVWQVRCASRGQPYSSSQVISRFSAALQQQVKQDWARTQGDIRVNSGVPMSWLRGRSPVLSGDRFLGKWRASGVLWVPEGEGVRLCLPQ